VLGGKANRVPKRAAFSAPLASLKVAYPILSFPDGRGRSPVKKGVSRNFAQTPFLDAQVLLSAWGLPNVPPAEAGYPAGESQGSIVWVWQFHDKRVIARVQVWPIRKSKPYVEKIEVLEAPVSAPKPAQ
jgi:hypothetical protein